MIRHALIELELEPLQFMTESGIHDKGQIDRLPGTKMIHHGIINIFWKGKSLKQKRLSTLPVLQHLKQQVQYRDSDRKRPVHGYRTWFGDMTVGRYGSEALAPVWIKD
ncbi:hypothetical protein L1987_34270 [Smallanthus sonchifolius]|uniref:Uncharacterized protein n=1 Tax=Smallanthus sonchifolius TaxID=185202 RepID=A0ACB9HT26_9ASTR|nr:hypothetical protein L1987_34270 [Smallanthus sonchifolius]